VLDVIKATEGATRYGIHGKHWRDLESLPGYHQLGMASQIVEDALHRVTLADLKEQASSPTESYDARRCRSSRGDLQFTGILRILHAIRQPRSWARKIASSHRCHVPSFSLIDSDCRRYVVKVFSESGRVVLL
jgi:hypothetical protein